MRSYEIVCPSCNGLGRIDNPALLTNCTQIVCPACKGTKTIMCHETGEGE